MKDRSANPAGVCPDEELMIRYFQAELSEPEAAAIDAHFAECELCIDAARAAHEHALALDGWSARSHGDAWRRSLVEEAVKAASAQGDAAVKARFERWRGNLRAATAGAIEVVATLSGVRLIASGLSDLVRSDGWQFEPVGVMRDASGNAPSTAVTAKHHGLKVEVLPDGRLEIRGARWPEAAPLPAVVIIDKAGVRPPQVVQATRDSSGNLYGVVSGPAPDSLIIFLNDSL